MHDKNRNSYLEELRTDLLSKLNMNIVVILQAYDPHLKDHCNCTLFFKHEPSLGLQVEY